MRWGMMTVSEKRSMRYYRRRGFETERMLVRALRDAGVWAYRIPASGMYEGRRQMSLPDVIAYVRERVVGFQLKATSKSIYEVKSIELVPLRAFLIDARSFGIATVGYIGVRFVDSNNSRWVFRRFEPNEIEQFEYEKNGKTKKGWRWANGGKLILQKGHGYSLKSIIAKLVRGEIRS